MIEIQPDKQVRTEQVADTAQYVTYTTYACGCEQQRYSMPGHCDVVREYNCGEHDE